LTVSPDVESRAIVGWPAIARGALVGLGLIIPITILDAILDRRIDDFEDSGWRVLIALLIMAAFIPAGAYAARFTPNAPLTNGALAGLGAFAVWIPFRVLIWLTRDDNRGLVSGNDPVLRLGQIFGFLVISTALGMVGGYLVSRRQRTGDSHS
jgi:4-amino-4-deoxy-L-arabinose transferase-like glycosyltransferase